MKMWEMLLSQKSSGTKISFGNISTTEEKGTATWKAEYLYGDKNRKVINKVFARFKFKDGRIIEHIDYFNLWRWTQQALGPMGYLMGWTPFMRNKIQKTVKMRLDDFIRKE